MKNWTKVVVLCYAMATLGAISDANAAKLPNCVPAKLRSTIYAVERNFGPVEVLSTYRRGAKVAGTKRASYHATCKAIDFHPGMGKYSSVLAWLRQNHNGGLGTYSGRLHHLHIDAGPNRRFHKKT